jgi:hypothetical protein
MCFVWLRYPNMTTSRTAITNFKLTWTYTCRRLEIINAKSCCIVPAIGKAGKGRFCRLQKFLFQPKRLQVIDKSWIFAVFELYSSSWWFRWPLARVRDNFLNCPVSINTRSYAQPNFIGSCAAVDRHCGSRLQLAHWQRPFKQWPRMSLVYPIPSSKDISHSESQVPVRRLPVGRGKFRLTSAGSSEDSAALDLSRTLHWHWHTSTLGSDLW